ncbi:proteasome subunit alpha type-5 [Tanacetum coccineum]
MGGRGVKQKNKDVVAKDVVLPFVIDEPVVKDKQSSLVDTSFPNVKKTDLSLYPPLPTHGSTSTGNTPVMPVESIRAISERLFSSMDSLNAMLENYLWFIRNHPLILIKWNPDVNLLKEDVRNVLLWVKLYGVPLMAFSEDGLNAIATKLGTPLMLDSYTSNMLGVAKNLKKPSQAPRGVPVGMKKEFKPAKAYRHVSKKPIANTSGIEKKCVEPTNEVSNSNPFVVLNLVKNDRELSTNGGASNLASNGGNYSGSTFWNVETSCTSITPIVGKISKLEKLIIDGKVILVDDDGKPLKKFGYSGDHDSGDEVELVDNDMAHSMASKRLAEGLDSVLRDGPWMIHGVYIIQNKWSPSVSLLKEDLSSDPAWVKFHDAPLVTYTLDGLSLITLQIAPKRVVNKMDKGKGGSFGVDDEGVNQKTTPSIGKKNALTLGDGTFSINNSFNALNVKNSVSEEVEMGNKASTSVEVIWHQNHQGWILYEELARTMEGKHRCDVDYDLYDDDMYEGQDIPDNIQSICDNLDIKLFMRWVKNIIPSNLRNKRNTYCGNNEAFEDFANKATSLMDEGVHLLNNDFGNVNCFS